MTKQRFTYLLNGWIAGTISSQEAEEFLSHTGQPRVRKLLDEYLQSDLDASYHVDRANTLMRINALDKLKQQDAFKKQHLKIVKPAHRVHFLKTAWFRVAVACLLIFSIVAYFTTNHFTNKPGLAAVNTTTDQNKIMPGGSRATLKLADGSEIMLDDAANGLLAKQSGVQIKKTRDGKIIYAPDESSVNQVPSYNTMTTPRGGQYQLSLPDGTNVWLNAASSITYPASFTSDVREVTISGEAYFEVKKNPLKPFVVKTGKEIITVLGTSFNVNAYPDEQATKTSLLEGSVKIGGHVLKPSQAYINGQIIYTNLSQDLAWKNGLFNFDKMSLQQAMRQISNWYDVNVVYEGEIPAIQFYGEASRSLNLQDMLELLAGVGVKFRLEKDKRLIVTKG